MNALIEQMNAIAMGVELVIWFTGATLVIVALRVILDATRSK
jgi:hypothetical protein